MSVFASILVPLDGSHHAARSLGCATWLATRLGARLHLLSATPRQLPAREELARLQVPEAHRPLITLHQAPAYPEDAILAAVERHAIELVVITAGGRTAEDPAATSDPARIVGHVTRAILERSRVPVLLLPPNYRETLPWQRVLVPVSGEVEADEALVLAVHLARALDLDVHVAHVADAGTRDTGLETHARYADALHHEYPSQLEELVTRVLRRCAPEECRRIVDVALCRGDVASELLALIDRRQLSALVVGWHGRLTTDRARVLKRMLQALTIPVLLVKPPRQARFRLKVGDAVE